MHDLYIATQAFHADRDGTNTIVRAGEVAEEGHWLLAVRPDAFKALEVTYACAPAPKKKADPVKTSDAA